MTAMKVREYDQGSDFEQLRECVIELQNFERQIDARLPSGEDIVDEYVTQMQFRCRSCDGQILVETSPATSPCLIAFKVTNCMKEIPNTV